MIVRMMVHMIMAMTTTRTEAMMEATTVEIRRASGSVDDHVLLDHGQQEQVQLTQVNRLGGTEDPEIQQRQ